MPYIEAKKRGELGLGLDRPRTTGELNYAITRVCIDYLNTFGTKYCVINDIIGALECSKQEFYRRVAAAHEDDMKLKNGDVYDE